MKVERPKLGLLTLTTSPCPKEETYQELSREELSTTNQSRTDLMLENGNSTSLAVMPKTTDSMSSTNSDMSTDRSRTRTATTSLPPITSEMDKRVKMLTRMLTVLKQTKRLPEQDLLLHTPVPVTVMHLVKLPHKVSGAHTTLNNVKETSP